jgi:hypothetical protein
MRCKSSRSRPRFSLSACLLADPRQRSAPRQGSLRIPSGSSLAAEENRQFFERRTTCSRQHNIAAGIVQFQATEGDGDEMVANSGKIADGKDDVDIAILAENEIVDSSDRFVFVVDHGF